MHVPADVMVEILLRLSLVKSLCRFKCVSKLWCSLISDPRFVRRHLDLAIIDKDVECERWRLVLVGEEDIEHEWGKGSVSHLYQVECESMASSNVMEVKINHSFASYSEVKFIGSVNGLLCLGLPPDSVILFNPATKELKHIPKSRIQDILATCICQNAIYGFGYDQSSDDYNIVEITHNVIFSVYSLKTNRWRIAESSCYIRLQDDRAGVPLNGAVHWLFSRDQDEIPLGRQRWIAAFYFAKGEFRNLPAPPPSDAGNEMIGLGVLGGCLCWIAHNIGFAIERQYFWVMKESGVKESWTKVFAIDKLFIQKSRALSYLKDKEALLEINRSLVVYNPTEHTLREVSIRGIHGRRSYEIETYVESLVSPNA